MSYSLTIDIPNILHVVLNAETDLSDISKVLPEISSLAMALTSRHLAKKSSVAPEKVEEAKEPECDDCNKCDETCKYPEECYDEVDETESESDSDEDFVPESIGKLKVSPRSFVYVDNVEKKSYRLKDEPRGPAKPSKKIIGFVGDVRNSQTVNWINPDRLEFTLSHLEYLLFKDGDSVEWQNYLDALEDAKPLLRAQIAKDIEKQYGIRYDLNDPIDLSRLGSRNEYRTALNKWRVVYVNETYSTKNPVTKKQLFEAALITSKQLKDKDFAPFFYAC